MGDDFIGHQPENHYWTVDGSLAFEWNPNNEPGNSQYNYDFKKKIALEVDQHNPNQAGALKQNWSYFIFEGNLYHKLSSGEIKTVVKSSERISDLQHYSNSENYYFISKQKLIQFNPSKNQFIEIAHLTPKKKSQDSQELNYLEKQQLELFDFIQEENQRKNWQKDQSSPRIPTIYYEGDNVRNIQIDGSGNFILFREDFYPNKPNTEVQHFISNNGFAYTQNARSKVSMGDPHHRLGIYNISLDTTYYVDFSTLPDIRKKPTYMNDDSLFENDRDYIMHQVVFSENRSNNVVDIRAYDNKDRWIVSIDLDNGSIDLLDHQHDEAWIGGPGISNWNMVPGTLGFIDENTIYYQSEEIGYSHLFSQNIFSKERTQLTDGNWEVYAVQLSKDHSKFFISGNKTHPGNRDFYHLDIRSQKLTSILTNDGFHDVQVSPDEKTLAVRYSDKNSPWDLYIASNKANTELTRITHSTSPKFETYQWHEPEVITFSSNENTPVYARLYEPDIKNGAAVIFVHGAGYLQNAHNYWSTYHREYMFHNLLRDNGFTVLDIDYRASQGYGRDHRTAIYRHMGGADLDDQLSGRQLLIDSLGIDPERIGIYGGSYGGFMTLMALLTQPGKFKCGAALRSVTDWAHYNHEYTSNILNYPETDSVAYRQSSPIYFAENLEDRLLILHGMVDDNVQFQDVVRLSQRFIELEKTNWEMAVFPVEAHGFKKSSSWNDEYRRIYELFYEELILNFNK